MKQGIQLQIIFLLMPLLASTAFTTSSTRTTNAPRVEHKNWQLQQRSVGLERLSIDRPLAHLSVASDLPYGHQQYSSSSTIMQLASSGDELSSSENNSDDKVEKVDVTETSVVPVWKRILLFYKYNKDGSIRSKDDDGLTFKQKLAKMGLSVLLSYGFVSNMCKAKEF